MQPEAIEHEGSRRKVGMQELRLSFVQWDTFNSLVDTFLGFLAPLTVPFHNTFSI